MTDLGFRRGRGSAASWLAAVLLAGTGLLAVAGAIHPMLPDDVAGELRVIAQTQGWRVIHLSMIGGTALVVTGLWSRVLIASPSSRRTLIVVLVVIAIGLVLNAVNIAFMAQVGTGDAARYISGDRSAAAIFARRHDVSLLVARVGNYLVALGCIGLGVLETADRSRPRWVGISALAAGVGGLIGVIASDPASRGGVAAVTLFAAWAAASAVLFLTGGGDRDQVPGS